MSIIGKLFFGKNERLSVEQIQAEYEAEKLAKLSFEARNFLEFLDVIKSRNKFNEEKV